MGKVKSLLLDYEHLDEEARFREVRNFLSIKTENTCTSNKCCVTSKHKEAKKRKKRCH
jgi:hypothetical protein|tara:strand:- start:87 stop:260 length:174 start_codon:yes stop_codon:yes gene_type:complete